MLGVGGIACAAWVSGTTAGAIACGGALQAWPAANAGSGFVLTAMFPALFLSISTRAQVPAIAVAAVACVAVALSVSPAVGILAGTLAGTGAWALGYGTERGPKS